MAILRRYLIEYKITDYRRDWIDGTSFQEAKKNLAQGRKDAKRSKPFGMKQIESKLSKTNM